MHPLANLNINNQKGRSLYAQAKTSAEMQFAAEREKLTSSSIVNSTKGFANPMQNAQKLGIEEGMQVADLGAGSGHYVLAIANLVGESGTVYAVDVQKGLLDNIKNEVIRRGYDNVEIVWGDLEKSGGAKIADNTLDLVLISNTLFQVKSKQILLQEAWRILKLSGTLVVIDWSESFGNLGPIVTNVISKEQATSLVLSSGFVLQSEFDAGAHHYGLIFNKI